MPAAPLTIPSPLEAWNIRPEDFPQDGSNHEKLRFLLGYAVLAPSSHNTQPWLFRIQNSTIELYADRTRGLRTADPDDRELVISCGAALFCLKTAMQHFGYLGGVEILPDPEDPDLLARVHYGYQSDHNLSETLMFHAITKRRTNRQEFKDDPIPASLLSALVTSASTEHASLKIIEAEDAKHQLADLIAEGDRRQWASKRFRLEVAAWAHPNRSQAPDGIPGYAMGLEDLLSYAGPLLIRTFDMGEGQAARDREIATGSPCLAVLATKEDTVRSWIAAGQALTRVMLRARIEDVWVSFLNQAVEVPELRKQTAALVKSDPYPQLVLRLGFGEEVRPTPRRSVSQVVI